MPPFDGYGTHTPLQQPSQESATEAEAPIRTYQRRWKASDRALESKEQESLNRNTSFTAVQGQEEGKHYYEAMHKDDYKIHDEMEDPLAYLASSDLDTMYFDQAT